VFDGGNEKAQQKVVKIAADSQGFVNGSESERASIPVCLPSTISFTPNAFLYFNYKAQQQNTQKKILRLDVCK